MRKLICLIIILSGATAFAASDTSGSSAGMNTYDVSAEYRHDILDVEEEETDFYRCKGSVSGSQNTGAFAAAAWMPDEKRKTYTFSFLASDPSIPFSITGGDYNVQFGSGLLIGHGRPYNPDPFQKEVSVCEESGIRPVTSGSQSSSFRGFSLAHSISDSLSTTVFCSRALRYYSGGDSSSSIGTLLSRPDKEGKNTEPVYLRCAGGMITFTRDLFITSISGFHADLISPSGKRILWAVSDEGGGYRSSSGGSLYSAYNDGVLRAYIDFALSSSGYIRDGKNTRINDKAFQSEADIHKESFDLRLAAKSIGKEYYSPFFAPIGSKSPSNSFFWEATISPLESFSLSSDAAIEKKKTVTNFDPEPSSTCREGVSIAVKPFSPLILSVGHRLTGRALESFPERQQFRGGIKFDFSGYDQTEIGYIEQRKSGAVSRVFQCQAGIGIARVVTIGLTYAEIRAKTDDNVYLSPLPLDGVMVPWIAVNGRARLASMRVAADWKGLSLHAKGLCLWTGRTAVHRRLEFAIRGSW
ncbi:MAG TPA: hypothetical protein PKK43_07110 [Spirochaetota bacterium]|nr:hypothetical protein [Spirochaetota bacterium]